MSKNCSYSHVLWLGPRCTAWLSMMAVSVRDCCFLQLQVHHRFDYIFPQGEGRCLFLTSHLMEFNLYVYMSGMMACLMWPGQKTMRMLWLQHREMGLFFYLMSQIQRWIDFSQWSTSHLQLKPQLKCIFTCFFFDVAHYYYSILDSLLSVLMLLKLREL